MKKEKEEKARVRKEYAKGGSSQKMMTLRVDLDLMDWLTGQPNKGRYINNLIRADWERQKGGK